MKSTQENLNSENPSLAIRVARRCDKGYYVAQSAGDDYHVRIYGNDRNGSGIIGLWQLLTDVEIIEIGHQFGIDHLTAFRFQPGGIVVPKQGGATCYAVAVAVLRHLGLNTDVQFL